jgi:hypothetical protein
MWLDHMDIENCVKTFASMLQLPRGSGLLECQSDNYNKEARNRNVEKPLKPSLSRGLPQIDHSRNGLLCATKAPEFLGYFVSPDVSGIPPSAMRTNNFNVIVHTLDHG